MTTRTFKQLGQGFGIIPCTITAKIDGVTVYSGTVPTVNQPLPAGPAGVDDGYPDLFTWTNDVNFAGTQSMEITVTGSPLLLAAVNANYVPQVIPVTGKIENPDPNWVPTNYESSGPSTYNVIFKESVGDKVYTDPTTNVVIDGIAKSVTRNPELTGQRHWLINPGSTFTCQLNVQAGLA